MSLKKDIELHMREALKAASKDEDEKVRLSTLRLLMAEIKNMEIEKKKELSDDEVIEAVLRHTKKRKEAIEIYQKVGRTDAAKKEQKELNILQSYLPAQLTKDEVEGIIAEAIKSTGAHEPRDMGKVMKEVMPRLKGRADAKMVNELVRGLLAAES
ncbi:GatB/YqeY domain-containing protein [Candidatus Oleimmundimicrobium sp.]|uniref:GatB/YqeY domain-containing protein n=1 Tax=Candidatus Oleimmundimicrobium sp. TaxID=3060597 RepID=UPI0027186FBD|nr:GatB/YqeY domain-containing protein [Candidatus Oleimmundimicrobium sp.]MDO8885847.1 GatB/YqeY domain-containing protein [Candidatus Oleimmundimicrobium sp.]